MKGEQLVVTLLDFSSAWSLKAEAAGLYGTNGPSRDEETLEYMPPERLLSDVTAPAPQQDAWAIGVVLLEVLLGTRQAFQVDPRTRAFVERSLRGASRFDVEKALLEAAFADLCVLPKDATPCAPTDLLDELQERDPLEVGFASYLGVDGADFLASLLTRDPADRALPSRALEHPFLRRAASQQFNNKYIEAPFTNQVELPKRLLDAPPYTLKGTKRTFGVWESCRTYAARKGINAFCAYNSSSLPPCLSAQRFTLDGTERHYGLCDLRGRRARIEDHHSVIYDDAYALWGVFDGHGGRAAARHAARELPALLGASSFKEGAIRDAFLTVDAAFDDPKHAKSGSTATVVAVVGESLVVANVGDSRAVAVTADGAVVVLTRDHVASNKTEARRIRALGGRILGAVQRVEDQIVLTRSIGNRALDPYLVAEPHVRTYPLSTFRFLVVATDGLWDVVSSADAARFVGPRLDGSRDAAQRAATALAHEALVRQSTDNVCAIVVDLAAEYGSSL